MKLDLMGASALVLMAASAIPCMAAAQETAPAEVDAIIVTGTRTTGLRAVDSPAPIQVLGNDVLKRTGQPDLVQALAQNVPSITAQAFGGDTAAFNLNFKLRGLSPNHALVLVNGKRRHGTANVVVSGGPYGGGAAADMAFIPVSSIDHVEVLQDGAAAQYGTDAIAGVINVILKKSASGGSISATGGEYIDGGGRTGSLMANFGFQPNDKSYINISGETKYHGFSFRGDVDPRVINTGTPSNTAANLLARFPQLVNFPNYPYVNRVRGDSQYRLSTVTYNAGYELAENLSVYSFGSYGYKKGKAYENYRIPTVVTGVQATDIPFPMGFQPLEQLTEHDFAFTGGIEGSVSGWNWDLSSTFGKDTNRIDVINSANASLYRDTSSATRLGYTPRDFHDGDFIATQWSTTLDVSKEFEVGMAEPLTLAGGVEYRKERYQIKAGDPSSYYGTGAQSFFGYSPVNASNNTRNNKAVYVNVAGAPIAALKLDAAVRYENFSDFGDTTVAKLTGRYDFSDAFAIRATASTGFRAPTLAEGFYSGINVGPTSVSGVFAPNSPGATFLGINGLKPEKSTNYSVGFVTHLLPKLTMTLDVYQITLEDRIIQSGNFTGFNANANVIRSPSVLAALIANGVTIDPSIFASPSGSVGVVSFVNGVDTRTSGADFVATYSSDFGDWGTVDWHATANVNRTKITKVYAAPANLDPRVQLLDTAARSTLEHTAPEYKITIGGYWTKGKWSVNLKESLYGPAYEMVQDPVNAGFLKNEVEEAFITDLEVAYQVIEPVRVMIGANNLFNKYPSGSNPFYRQGQYFTNSSGYASSVYPSFSAFGINGGYYYGKITYTF